MNREITRKGRMAGGFQEFRSGRWAEAGMKGKLDRIDIIALMTGQDPWVWPSSVDVQIGQIEKCPTKLLRQFGSSQTVPSPAPLKAWPRV